LLVRLNHTRHDSAELCEESRLRGNACRDRLRRPTAASSPLRLCSGVRADACGWIEPHWARTPARGRSPSSCAVRIGE